MTAPVGSRERGRSRAVATWLALVGGSLGLHRFYLHGAGDGWAWLHPWPTLAGAYGFWRMRELGVDDPRGSLLVLLLGAMLAISMLQAILLGLTSDELWERRHGGSRPAAWPTWVAVGLALALGASIAMATIAFAAQRWFESRAEAAAAFR
ncbi:MAG: TM2 domain-containing protein [Caldimonas sp.]